MARSRSLRRSLLGYYALIFVLVLGAFGTVLYEQRRGEILAGIDDELHVQALLVANAIDLDARGRFELDLPQEALGFFAGASPTAPAFAIWLPDGSLGDASRPELRRLVRPGLGTLVHGSFRGVVVPGPTEVRVLVGRDVQREHLLLTQFAGLLIAVGGLVLFVALLGGWFLVRRALAPIDNISRAASVISAQNLSERIDAADTESELGRLVAVLNSAFDRLAAALQRQTRFTADASHELRTPLAVVIAQAELALRRERTPLEYREALLACLKAGQRMQGVVDGLLTLARADAGEFVANRAVVDLGRIVRESTEMLRPLAEQRRVNLALEVEPAGVRGDPEHLREVATNLVANAIHYNREDGRVEVLVRREQDQVVLQVTDTGIGIAEPDQMHLFERFFRVDTARSRARGGSGLGLAIVQAIVTAHRGEVSCRSQLGLGSEFTVRLPAESQG